VKQCQFGNVDKTGKIVNDLTTNLEVDEGARNNNTVHDGEIYSIDRVKTPPKNVGTFLKRLSGYFYRTGPVPLEKKDKRERVGNYVPPRRSILSYVDYETYDHVNKQIITDDGRRGVFLDILPADVEGLDNEIIDVITDKINLALGALPGEDIPWIIQVYQNDEDSRGLLHEIKTYSESKSEKDEYKKEWFKVLEEHFATISRREGVFTDKKGMHWRSRYRRIRMVIYRNLRNEDPQLINAQIMRLTEALNEAGVDSHRMDAKDIYKWLMPWLSGEAEKAYEFMETIPYPEKEEKNDDILNYHFAEHCFRGRKAECVNDPELGKFWLLGNRYNRFISLLPYKGIPNSGHWVLEGNSGITPFDRMPDGATLLHTITIVAQDKMEATVVATKSKAIGDGLHSMQTREDCDKALEEIAKGNRLINVMSGIYVDGNSLDELNERSIKCVAACQGAGFDTIEPIGKESDLSSLDSFVRGLPMVFDLNQDRKAPMKSRMGFDRHISNLLPVLTRGRGTTNYGLSFNSTGGEPISFDPMGADRSENAHMFLFGSTGSGKTTALISMLQQVMATHNPRMFLITSLPTFNLLGDYFERFGKTVNKVHITRQYQPSLPPFADITKHFSEKDINDDTRDYIGEAELAAQLLITKGKKREEDRYHEEDISLVKKALIETARRLYEAGTEQAMVEDLAETLHAWSKDHDKYPSENYREKLSKYANILDGQTTGLSGQLFNRPGEAWPDVDVTIVSLDLLGENEAYADKLAIVVSGLMAMINQRVIRDKNKGRHTITVLDEAHIMVKHPKIGPQLNTMISTWRTYGSWLWIATQKLDQIPDEAITLITQPEWWIGLTLKDAEIEKVNRFIELNPHQKKLLSNCRKESRKYTEGGILSVNLNTIIRFVLPAITIAIAATDKEERAERAEIMEKYNISELDAAFMVADMIQKSRIEYDPSTENEYL
jgi:conjugative transfer ATPase